MALKNGSSGAQLTVSKRIGTANFAGKDIKFVFPDVFIQKHLHIGESEMDAIKAAHEVKSKQDHLAKNQKNAEDAYNKAVSAFNLKWKRKVSNDLIDESEE